MRSPYFVGSKLWDLLPIAIIEAHTISMFRKLLKPMNRVYVDLSDFLCYSLS